MHAWTRDNPCCMVRDDGRYSVTWFPQREYSEGRPFTFALWRDKTLVQSWAGITDPKTQLALAQSLAEQEP